MQSLSDDERKIALGEVLADELKVILEYVQEIPNIQSDIRRIDKKLDKTESRVTTLEYIVKAHEKDLRYLKTKFA